MHHSYSTCAVGIKHYLFIYTGADSFQIFFLFKKLITFLQKKKNKKKLLIAALVI